MIKTKEELKTAVEAMDDDQIALLSPKVEALTMDLEAPPRLETPWTYEQVIAEREADDKRARYESEPLLLSRTLLLFNNGGLWQLIKEPDNAELDEVLHPTYRLNMYYGIAKRIIQRRDTMTEEELAVVNGPDYHDVENNVLAYIGAYSLERTVNGDHDDGKYANPEKLCRKVEEYLNALCQSITGWPCINVFEGLTYEKDWDTWPAFPGMAPPKKEVAEVAKPEVVAEPASKPSEAVLKSFSDDEVRAEAELRGIIKVEGTSADVVEALNPDAWMNIAKSVLGQHEDHDTKSLMEYFEKGGFTWDPRGDAHAWCGAYVRATLAQAGLPVLESLKAADWKAYGEPCEEKFGALVVGKSHVAFCLGDGKLIGGNQGDMVKEGNIEWYISDPVFRWPVA